MAKEYIEREAYIKMVKDIPMWGSVAAMMADCVPTADVVEVVHGRWLKTEEPLGWHEVDCIECSACHDSWIVDEDYGFDISDFWNYCPNCGARMDGE